VLNTLSVACACEPRAAVLQIIVEIKDASGREIGLTPGARHGHACFRLPLFPGLAIDISHFQHEHGSFRLLRRKGLDDEGTKTRRIHEEEARPADVIIDQQSC